MPGRPVQPRERILARIRGALGVTEDDAERRVTVQRRLSAPPSGTIPERSRQSSSALVAQFCERLEQQATVVKRVPDPADLPATIAEILKGANLPARLRSGADPFLAGLPWAKAPSLEIASGRAEPGDAVGLAKAWAGLAETGTLVLLSGPDNPTTLNFLPDTQIVVIEAKDIAGPFERIWTEARRRFGDRSLPSTVNLVSGPSRTADIEQTMILGAHGPRTLVVLVTGEPS